VRERATRETNPHLNIQRLHRESKGLTEMQAAGPFLNAFNPSTGLLSPRIPNKDADVTFSRRPPLDGAWQKKPFKPTHDHIQKPADWNALHQGI